MLSQMCCFLSRDSSALYSFIISKNECCMNDSAPLITPLLTAPLRLIPNVIHSSALSIALNRFFSSLLAEGELDFLQDKVLRIAVEDAWIEYRLSQVRGKLIAVDRQRPIDASFVGSLRSFMLLALRREDPDTLFFQRRLRMEGDTEIGLMVKNLLDSMEFSLTQVPVPLQTLGNQVLSIYEKYQPGRFS